MDNPFMVSARYLLDFFEAKYLAWSSCHFDELYRKVRRSADQTTTDVVLGVAVVLSDFCTFFLGSGDATTPPKLRQRMFWVVDRPVSAGYATIQDAHMYRNLTPTPRSGTLWPAPSPLPALPRQVNERHERLHQHPPDAELPKFRFESGAESESDSYNCWRGSSGSGGGGGSVGRSDAGGGGGFAALKPPAGGAEGEGGGGGGGGGRPAEENSAGGESGSLAPSCPPGPP